MNSGMNSRGYSDSESDESNDMEFGISSGLVGLQNIGNTCYMNAALQALSNALPLTRFFLDCSCIVQLLSEGKKPGLCMSYQSLINEIWLKNKGGFVSASGILYGIRSIHPIFRGFHQHDTQEFLRNFMDQLHEELKQQYFNNNFQQTFRNCYTIFEASAPSSDYDSSEEEEYETCDSGVSETSSLSDEVAAFSNIKERQDTSNSSLRHSKTKIASRDFTTDLHLTNPSELQASSTKKQLQYRSIISDIFDGKILSSVQCLTCNRVSHRVETFQDLSLPLPSRDHLILLQGRAQSDAVTPVDNGWIFWVFEWFRSWLNGPTITLHDCLSAFFSTDELKGDNMYSCEKCNKLRNGIKFSEVLQLPEILCIHLKRFRHELMFSSKISATVSFPLKILDMEPYCHKDCVSKIRNYELFSVICHHGTVGAGHYTSFALNDGKWYEFDDQYVTEVSAGKVESCEAYVLFYRKKMDETDNIRDEILEMMSDESSFEKENETVFVSKQWMNKFNTCAEPGPIDNSDFLCQHGLVHPDKTSLLDKLSIAIPKSVYGYLYNIYGGCLPVTSVQICSICQLINKRVASEIDTFIRINTQLLNRNAPATHLLASSWYNSWVSFVNKKILEIPGPIDNSIIKIDEINMSECIHIPKEIWNFFHEIYGGGPEIRLEQRSTVLSCNDNTLRETEFEKVNHTKEEMLKTEKFNFSHGEPVEVGEANDEGVNIENNYEEYSPVSLQTSNLEKEIAK